MTIDAQLQILIDTPLHFLDDPFVTNMIKLFNDDSDADLQFKVGEDIIHGPKLIFKMNCEVLYDFCKDEIDQPIELNDIKPDIFEIVRRYIYEGGLSDSLNIASRKEFIAATDKFGVSELKLKMEKILIDDCIFDDNNVSEWPLFSDSMTLLLLKEYYQSYFVARASYLLESDHCDELKESPKVLIELMKIMSNPVNKDKRHTDGPFVNKLWQHLHAKGLHITLYTFVLFFC